MLPICNFYNKFSILETSDSVEWVPDGPVPPWSKKLAREHCGSSGFGIFLKQRVFYKYIQLLPGAEMIYLKVWT